MTAVDEMFINRVDWSTIEEDPDQMSAELYRAFEEAINKYGEPRGALLNAIPKKVEEGSDDAVPDKATKAEEDAAVVSKLESVNWGELDDIGKPKISNSDFDKMLANVMRHGNRGK